MDKKLLASICAVATGISCLSVSAFADSTVALKSFEPTSDNVKMIGRTYYNGESLWFSHSASGVEFTFTGTTAQFTVTADGNAIGSTDGARIVIYADGARVKDVMQTKKTQNYTVTLDSGEHTVKLLKASESANGSILIDSIAVDGDSISPTAANSHKIEFIGDSITCGYGIDGTGSGFNTKTEDGTRTYAYKTAQLLDADYSMVSVSGSGIVSGYTGGGKANTQNLMPDFYGLLGHSWGWIDGKNIDQVEWDFSSYTPDLIVINLGTNDASYTKHDADTRTEEFKQGYIKFLKQVRAANPDSEILCTLGIMGQDLYTAIEAAVEDYTKETGDTKVNTFEFNVQDTATNGVGIDWHPSEKSHVAAAKELSAKITELYSWQEDSTVDISASENYLVPTVETDSSVADSSSAASSESESSNSESSADSSSQATASGAVTETSSVSASSTAASSTANTSSKAASSSSTVSKSGDSNPTTGLQAVGAAVTLIGLAGITVSRKKK